MHTIVILPFVLNSYQPKKIMCLVQSVDKGLEPNEVAHHLEDPQNPHDPQQPHDLPRLADDVQIFKPSQENGEEVGNQGNQVHLEYQ